MKRGKYLRKTLVLLLVLTFFTSLIPSAHADTSSKTSSKSNDFRGVWVATVVNIDYPIKPTTDPNVLKSEALAILDYARDTGFNAVFLQVRPTSDAFYKSDIFPWSRYLTGKQGTAPGGGFDPLEFWVAEAHKRGLELHAWINPFRITKRENGQPKHDFSSLHPSNPAVKNPGWVVKHSDGNLYYNPGIPEVRKLIVDGIVEIIKKYDVDGIHFDDYFYPDRNFDDSAAYKKYNPSGKKLDDWRRDNINTLIRDVRDAIRKASSKSIRFGISPFGIWANKSSNPLGSDTKGLEAYSTYYADSLYWINNELIDYIAPQLYWNIGYSVADYQKLLKWWCNAVSGKKVDLYIGQAAYKAGDPSPSSPWYGTAEIERQMKLNEQYKEVKGSLFFNYNVMARNPALTAVVRTIFDIRDGKTPAIKVSISRPLEDITTSLDSFYLNGTSDPSLPLYLNGKLVENRSPKGYFGVLVPLSVGANSFTLSQAGSYETRTIYRTASSSEPEKMSKVDIPATSAFPQSQEYWMPGEKITLSCEAPAGATVTVKLDGKTYTMKQATGPKNPSGLYKATYTYEYTMPSYTGNPRIIDLGAPVYTVNCKGTVKTRTAPASIGVILQGTRLYAEVKNDVIDTYPRPVSGISGDYEIYRGMVDSVTGMTGSYVRLMSGQWVSKSKVNIEYKPDVSRGVVKKAIYTVTDNYDIFELTTTAPAAAIVDFDGQKLVLRVAAPSAAGLPRLPADALISNLTYTTTIYKSEFVLTKGENRVIDGYHIEKTDTGIRLMLKHKPKAENSPTPLAGITIMLDAGHGGSESGAIGPLGLNFAEKDINLAFTYKLKAELEALGAEVLLTRTDDSYLSLSERLAMSRNARPDMFISLHANSMADNVDISKVSGFSVFYREDFAKPAAQLVYDYVIKEHGRKQLGVNQKNFYVIRNTWAPSFLLENAFVPNPIEFEWLTNEAEQVKLAKTVAKAVVEYFK